MAVRLHSNLRKRIFSLSEIVHYGALFVKTMFIRPSSDGGNEHDSNTQVSGYQQFGAFFPINKFFYISILRAQFFFPNSLQTLAIQFQPRSRVFLGVAALSGSRW